MPQRILMTAGAAGIVLGATVIAWAATPQHHASRTRPTAANSGAEHIITNQCLPTDDPCRTKPDGW